MTTVTIEEAQSRLPEIIQRLQPGEEITITDHGQPLAQVKKAERTSWPCKAGSAKDRILWIAPDFDAPLDAFREYMEQSGTPSPHPGTRHDGGNLAALP